MTFLSDFQFHGDHVIAKHSGTRIPLNRESLTDAARAAGFVCEVQALCATRLARGVRPAARIAFHPQRPRSYYAIWPVCRLANVKIVDDPADADLLFQFKDRPTVEDAPDLAGLDKPVLNGACTDIRKSRVASVFEEIFGYPLRIDPATYEGLAVQKSEGNGVHDGQIVACPLDAPEPGQVYQRLIQNTVDGREFIDIRTPIVGGRIPLVYLKCRTARERFSNNNHRVVLREADEMYSSQELETLQAFANAMGLDFGGLDVLRHKDDGRIYVVDVNKTDMGPPTALPNTDKMSAMRRLAAAFSEVVAERLRSH
ncbi:MAG: hypothetical protein AAGL49_07520 [Pseudomonadota bacterium]